MAFARAADAPVHVVHLSCADALRHVAEARARAAFAATAETCPHYLALTDARYDEPDPHRVREERDLAAAPAAPATRTRCGPGSPPATSRLVATDHVPDRVAIEKGDAGRGVPFDRISNGAPGIETLLAVVYGLGRGHGPDRRRADGRSAGDHPGAAVRADPQGTRSRPGRDADLVLFDPAARRTIRQADLHHTSDFTPYEGIEVAGAVRDVFVRGRAVIRDGRGVGDRGWGTFVERGAAGG